MRQSKTTRDLIRELLGRMGNVDECVIVRVVTRNKEGVVIAAKHAPISYLNTINSTTEAICIEVAELESVEVYVS